jgi:hypothetical protein
MDAFPFRNKLYRCAEKYGISFGYYRILSVYLATTLITAIKIKAVNAAFRFFISAGRRSKGKEFSR